MTTDDTHFGITVKERNTKIFKLGLLKKSHDELCLHLPDLCRSIISEWHNKTK